ncbi:MAG: DNA mismatch repair endonuclease MutL, partial [Kiritimatiellae bacterium]|nr:DNA mismatch repair endonuclease MutL [Kiritimatiellia bacterium]
SVLKELVENSFDAGATQIDVDIAVGGRKLVSITDNGRGMSRDDALLSIERHATSKIKDVDDIENINSLGFRGEALAAIASVSRFRMETCAAGEDAGTEISISGGKLYDVRDAGCPVGTKIEIRDLFFNVPARRKFMRSQQTELAHIRTGFIVQSLAHPEVGMSLTVDGRELYRLSGNGGVEDRICELFGTDRIKSVKLVDYKNGDVAIHGYVGLPSASRTDRNEQYVFVNGRATSAAVIGYGIREGYHTLLPKGRHPSVFLFLEVDPQQVDVNVHPTKREVRFRRPSDVRDVVIRGISSALTALNNDLINNQVESTAAFEEGAEIGEAEKYLKIDDLPPQRAFKYPRRLADELFPDNLFAAKSSEQNIVPSIQGDAENIAVESAESSQESGVEKPQAPWGWCRVLGQIGGLYVIMETDSGMVTMDPHAAHERVLFERFMTDVNDRQVESQSLLLPVTVDLDARDALRVRKQAELFKSMGFGISEFGGDAFVVDALPTYFSAADPKSLLIEIAHGLEQAGGRGGSGRWREESIAQSACKASVKARDHLSLEEIERLVVDLSKTNMPYTCPHGRPTLVFASFHEINRKFGRV